jgi:hypothetical protein
MSSRSETERAMRETLKEVFATMLGDEPPMGVTAALVRQRGRQRLYRRRAIVAAGSAVAIGASATAAMAYVPSVGARVASPGPTGSAEPAVSDDARSTPSEWSKPGPTKYEIPRCDGDGTAKNLADRDGPVLPDPQTAAQAVLAEAVTIAPGRVFTIVTAAREETSAKHPGAPRVYLIFDVADEDGTGSVNLELVPQAGMSASERAAMDLRAKPFSNCTEANVVEFPDGAVGMEYRVAFGTGRPDDSVQHTYYYGPAMDINAGAFLSAANDPTGVRGYRKSMPLTTGEVLAICRVVALA